MLFGTDETSRALLYATFFGTDAEWRAALEAHYPPRQPDVPPYAALSAYVDVPLDGPSEDEEGGEGGEPPPDDAFIAECAMCYHVGPCYDDGEAWVCRDEALCAERQCAAADVAAYMARCSVPQAPAPPRARLSVEPATHAGAPLLARHEMPGFYYANSVGIVTFCHHNNPYATTIKVVKKWEDAHRLAATLNAMRCREVAS